MVKDGKKQKKSTNEKMQLAFKWIVDHRGWVTLIIILLFLVLSSGLYLILNSKNVFSYPENMYYAFQIVLAVFVAAGVIVAVWQYYVNLQNYKTKQAIDLTVYYKENVLEKYIIIKQIYRDSGILDILHKVNPSKYKEFDNEEIEKLYDYSDIKYLHIFPTTKEFINNVINIFGTVDSNFYKNRDMSPHAINYMLISQVTNILNDLEYFAMNFTHNIADKDIIYQSIHQSYLDVVETMYFYISRLNYRKHPNDKYYTNVTSLYLDWKEKSKEKNKKAV